MASTGSSANQIDPRISGHIGQAIGLNTTFYHNGVPVNPWAIRRVDIYKTAVKDENLVSRVLFPDPRNQLYPAPAINIDNKPGFFQLNYPIPHTFTEGVYFDVWRFIGSNPGVMSPSSGGSNVSVGSEVTVGDQFGSNPPIEKIPFFGPHGSIGDPQAIVENPNDPLLDNENVWFSQCNKFWVFQDGWFLDDGLIVPRFAFEPLDSRFRKGEIRTLEVGVMPLPLYDYDNSLASLIPRLKAHITIATENCEVLIQDAPCSIGLRQGSYRSNVFTIQCQIDTSNLLIGTYIYHISVTLPSGELRKSDGLRLYIV